MFKKYMWKHYDAAPKENGGGGTDVITKAIGDLGEKQKAQIEGVKTELTKSIDDSKKELQNEISTAKGTSQKALDKVEELEKKAGTSGFGGGVQQIPVDFFSQLGKALSDRAKELTEFKMQKKGFGEIVMETKVVGNLASATSLTGTYFVTPQVVPGVIIKPYEELHVRDILPVGQTNSNTIRYVVDNGGQGGPAMTAEGATKPQSDRALAIVDSPVRKIATYFRVPEEMIDDIPYLQSFLAQIGVQEVMVVEDTQLLYGDGTGQNLTGLATSATAFAAGTSVIGASANEFDVVLAAKKQLRQNFFVPRICFINPVDYFNMIVRKATTNQYLFVGMANMNLTRTDGNSLTGGGDLMIDGIRVIEHNRVVAGDFIIGDPRYAAIFDRMGTVVRFYDQDQDNAIKNLITIVIEKRLALANYRPGAWVKGTFATAITDLTS